MNKTRNMEHGTWNIFFLGIFILIGSFVFLTNVKAEENSTTTPTIITPTSTPTSTIVAQTLIIRYENDIILKNNLEMPDEIQFEYTKNENYANTGVFSTTSTEKTVLDLVLQAVASVENLDISSKQLIYYSDWSPPSYYLKCITIDNEARCDNWQYTINGQYPNVGMDAYEIDDSKNNQIYLYFGDRYQITTDKNDYFQDENLVGTIYEYNYQDGIYVTSTNTNQVLAITKTEGWSDTVLSSENIDENGQVNLTVPNEIGNYNLGLENVGDWDNYYWPKKSFSISEYFSTNLMIRYQDQIILNQGVHLPTSSTYTYHNKNEEEILTTTTDKITVLGLLSSLDQTEINFNLSDVEYYESAWGNGFYVKCIDVVLEDESTKNACQNWQYIVDSIYPSTGMDQYELSEEGQNIYLYFGDRYQITTDKNEYTPLEQITANLYEFDYLNGVYSSSTSALDQLDLYQANPDWTNTVFVSSTVGENSQVLFTAPETEGNYNIGFNSYDWYWPYNSIEIKSNETGEDGGDTGGTGSGGYTPPPDTFINDAFSFLNLKIKNGNFFDNPIYTDWAAIAYASNSGNSSQKSSIIDYLLANPITGDTITDYERRAMALMAMRKSPYNSTNINYIQKIVNSFDGTQIGNNNLFNDDVFGLITLLNAGYNYEDQIISKSTEFIISKQNNIDGGFGGTDLTAATIQALMILNSSNATIINTIDSAKNYLKTMQTNNAGFKSNSNDTTESVFSTSWSLQAIYALGENESDWKNNNNKPSDYLQSEQKNDGGLLTTKESEQSRVWATSYAIPAYLNKTWDNILHNFDKQAEEEPNTPPTPNENTTNTSSTEKITTPTSTPTSTLDIILDLENTTTTIETDLNTTTTYKIEKENVTQNFSFDNEETKVPQITKKPNLDNNIAMEQYNNDVKPTTSTNKTELISQTLSSISTTTIPYSKTAKGVFVGATSLTGALGLYLAWRFLQTLI